MRELTSVVLSFVVVVACVAALPFMVLLSIAEDVYLLCWIGGDCIRAAWGRQA